MLPALLHDLFLSKQRDVVSCPETHEPIVTPLRPRSRSTDGLRMATWDQKRQTCFNCKHVFLKSLSTTPDYCSVDCKSNALYLLAVSQTIRAVKEAAAEPTKATHSETKVIRFGDAPTIVASDAEPIAAAVSADAELMSINDLALAMGLDATEYVPQTFAEFHTNKIACRPVEWSFSALY